MGKIECGLIYGTRDQHIWKRRPQECSPRRAERKYLLGSTGTNIFLYEFLYLRSARSGMGLKGSSTVAFSKQSLQYILRNCQYTFVRTVVEHVYNDKSRNISSTSGRDATLGSYTRSSVRQTRDSRRLAPTGPLGVRDNPQYYAEPLSRRKPQSAA